MMYFHIDQGVLHRMHQLTGLAMVAVVSLHIIKNFKPLLAYLGRREAWITAALVVVFSGAIAGRALYWKITVPRDPGPRPRDMMTLVATARLETVAELVDTDLPGLQARLVAQGFTVTTSVATLEHLARTAQRT